MLGFVGGVGEKRAWVCGPEEFLNCHLDGHFAEKNGAWFK